MESQEEHKRKLLEDAGAAHAALLHCPNCRLTLASRHIPHPTFNWGLLLSCSQCATRWVVCTLCPSIRKHMMENTSGPQRHHKQKHNVLHLKDAPNIESIPHQSNSRYSLPPTPNQSAMESNPLPSSTAFAVKNLPPKLFSRPENQNYFEQHALGHGLGYLVALSNFGKPNIGDLLDSDDVDMFISLAQFCSTQTRPQREELATVLSKVSATTQRHTLADGLNQSKSYISPSKTSSNQSISSVTKTKIASQQIIKKKQYQVRVPTSMEEIRSRIVEGKNSFFSNLPHPPISVVGEYAYILPSDCLLDLFGHGNLYRGRAKAFPPFLGLADSRISQMNRQQLQPGIDDIYHLATCMWSDDFEPNYSKLNRGSVWIKTISFHVPGRSYVPITNVYPLAVGPKGKCHELVERILHDDMEKLIGANKDGVLVYDGYSNCIRRVTAQLTTILQDQPERRRSNKLMLGNSTYHARFGVRMDYSQIQGTIRSCRDCEDHMLESMLKDDWIPLNCSECSNWSLNPDNPLLKFKAPENYPASETIEGQSGGTLSYMFLDFPVLKEVVTKAHEKFVSREWTKATTEAYLRVNCINSAAEKEIIECAENCYAWNNALSEDNEDILSMLSEQREKEPLKHRQWTWPAVWDHANYHIWQSAEVPMHVLFKGVVETTTSLIQNFFVKQRKYESFLRYMRLQTESLQNLHLSWLKAEPYTRGELGGWVSENYLALSRVSLWIYSGTSGLLQDETYMEPNKPQDRWTKVENQKWLSVRRLDTEGNAEVLRERVRAYLNQSDGPPEIPPPTGVVLDSHIFPTIITMSFMISYLMGMEGSCGKNEAAVSSLLIRMYLNSIYDVDVASREASQEQRKPLWLSSYNFLSLLNLPNQILHMGPLRNRWEGGVQGEGFLRLVKPTLTSPNRLNWTKNLLTNLVRQRSILAIKESNKRTNETDEGGDDDSHWMIRDSKFRTYQDLSEIEDAFTRYEPISIVVVRVPLEDQGDDHSKVVFNRFFAVFREGQTRRMFEFVLTDECLVVSWTLLYLSFEKGAAQSFPHGSDGKLVVSSYAVMLPSHLEKEENGEDHRVYTVIDHRWRVLGHRGRLDFPHRAYAVIKCNNSYGDSESDLDSLGSNVELDSNET